MEIKTFFYNKLSSVSDGAPHRCNKYIEEVLADLGHKVYSYELKPTEPRYKSLNYIPWDQRDKILMNQCISADVSIYCDRGISYGIASLNSSKFNLLLLHGLAYNYELIHDLNQFDLIITTSIYWAKVTKMMLKGVIIKNTDELNYFLLSPRKRIKYPPIYPVAPPIENILLPNKSKLNEFMYAHDLQENKNTILAHALQPNKANYPILVGTTIALSLQYRQVGRNFKIIVLEDNRNKIEQFIKDYYLRHNSLINHIMTMDEAIKCFIFTKRLKQSLLHELFEKCNFAFLYNDVPESFGMYALESIINKCPVFTNGAGNMRNAMPHNNGLYIYETWDLYQDHNEEYQHLANFIHEKLQDKEIKNEIGRGVDYITNNFNINCYKNQITHIIKTITKAVDGVKTIPQKYEHRSIIKNYRASPLIRKICVEQLAVIADHQFFTLSDEEMEVLCYINSIDNHSIDTKFPSNKKILKSLLKKGLTIFD